MSHPCRLIDLHYWKCVLEVRLLPVQIIPRGEISLTTIVDPFTVVCLLTWPLNGVEAAGDLALIKTSLLLLCKSCCSNAECIFVTKQGDLYQSKVTASLAVIQRPGHRAENCKMVY